MRSVTDALAVGESLVYGRPVDDLQLIREFAAAWNERAPEKVVKLVAPDVHFDRMRHPVRGADALLEGIERQSYGVGLYVFPRRAYGADGRYAVAARAERRYVESGEVAEVDDDSGAVIEIADGLITRFAPRPSLEAALADLGIGLDAPAVDL